MTLNKIKLDALVARYHRREFVHPDPLEFLYAYENLKDREIVGLIASSLAYGRVEQILKSVSYVLARMPSPHDFLIQTDDETIIGAFAGFKHRFTTGLELAQMLCGMKRAIAAYGSLGDCFNAFLKDDNLNMALCGFANTLRVDASARLNSLLPYPEKGGASKRLYLFLRWMARCDEIDPGGWDMIPRSALIIPLDTHIYNIGYRLRLTRRKQHDFRTALEITQAFKAIEPSDPVRYDFALTRPGIRKEMDLETLIFYLQN
jgi:uncharacterized protein (TIGR02757 family)